MKLEKENFHLRKLKFLEGNLISSFGVPHRMCNIDLLIPVKDFKTNIYPSSDLINSINSLSQYLANYNQDEKNEYRATGYSLLGEDLSIVIITGKKKCKNNTWVSVNTTRIDLEDDVFGFEEKLQEIILNIQHEYYDHLMNGKEAQQKIFD
ncbi:MAG TPA: hypothetical protein VKN74_02825 [Candidatus Mcinerneyibacterium sp.]|nr:hypothetical protein [Candidatus Mcinerneyibacterium sp.]